MIASYFYSGSPIDPSEIVNELFPNIWVFIAHLLASVVLLIMISKFVYNPFRKMMKKREKMIQDVLDKAVQKQKNADKNEIEASKLLTEAKTKASSLFIEIKNDAEQKKNEILIKAHQNADKINTHAKQTIEKEREMAKEDIKKQIIDVAFMAADKILEKEISKSEHSKMIDDFIKELE
ncbi:F0F1 ATP synthase subunit B [Spiroplasma endosymbiont of Amphibalanus improvisus]|uniref:F0F1 ATP synthase subunit B n=1 Tax=Spiroplasma endosymbiont of Amphibalanus improvisus TaxID=3066327 RepID=UPI00313F0333